MDLNRLWNRRSDALEPALHHVHRLMAAIDDSPYLSLDLYLDLHAHSSSKVGHSDIACLRR